MQIQKMGQMRKILQETHAWVCDMRDDKNANLVEKMQFTCQAWTLGQMISVADTLKKFKMRVQQRQK